MVRDLASNLSLPHCRVLILTSTILFVLASMSSGASLQQLIISLFDAPKTGNADASINYWADLSQPVNGLKAYAYTLIVRPIDFTCIYELLFMFMRKECHTEFYSYMEVIRRLGL